MKYQRDKLGILDFQGMNLVRAVDMMPPNKYPFAQNVRRYLQGGIMGRALQDVPIMTVSGGPVHTIRRLNDSTPSIPSGGGGGGSTPGGGGGGGGGAPVPPTPGGSFALSPTAVNFGTLLPNILGQILVQITFTGIGPETLTAVSLSNTQFQLNSLPVMPFTFNNSGDFAEWYVEITQPVGTYSAVMTIHTSVATYTVNVSATVATGGMLVIPTDVGIPTATVGQTSSPAGFNVTNNEANAVQLTGYSFSSPIFAWSPVPSFPLTIAPGQTLTFHVVATPPAATTYAGTLTIQTNVSGLVVEVNMTAGGSTLAGTLTVSPTTVAFPNTAVGSVSAWVYLTFVNNSPNAVDLTSGIFSPATNFEFSPNLGWPQGIGPGQNVSRTIVAKPQATGLLQATLHIGTSVAGLTLAVSVSVTGVAAGAAAAGLSGSGRSLPAPRSGGPPDGYVLIAGGGPNLWLADIAAAAAQIDTGYSGNPLALLPFRPNTSVQPWMYVGDSKKMTKVRSDGTVYKMGIKEPQAAPTVDLIPASDVLSLLGNVTVYFYNNPSDAHNPPLQSIYLWHNPADAGPTTLMQTAADANGSNEGNSLLFDYTPNGLYGTVMNGGPATEVQWSRYTSYVGTVSTSGTTVTWDSGDQFNGLVSGSQIVISGVTYTITGSPTNTTLTLTASAGNQVAANYTAAIIAGTVALFSPRMESEGFSDFNCAILGTFYVPAPGTYTFAVQAKDDFMWGIGNSPNGKASWPGLSGTQSYSSYGQSMTCLQAFPLIPRQHETAGEDGDYSSITIAITFTEAGNYPFEIDWDYWYHIPRGLVVTVNGANIPPVPPSAITNSQYIYTYRGSATGATSNGSPASQQSPLSVLANTVTALFSFDPQVDKIDFYRLDEGLSDYTYVGTIQNLPVSTTLTAAVTATGSPFQVGVASLVGITAGTLLQIDSETVTVISVGSGTITAVFHSAHASGAAVASIGGQLLDDLLDTDVAANPLLEYDNFEPFPVIDLPHQGLVNVVNGVVELNAGDLFDVRWLPGTIIIVGSIAYTLNTRPTSTTSLTCQNMEVINGVETVVHPPDGTSLRYEIAEPTLAAQPLAHMWGPTDNVAFFFACGDVINPGTLYWSKGNNPDSAPDTNQQNVTSPSEPLQNGCIVNGIGMVYSAERAWLIWPNYFTALATVTGTQGNVWTLQVSVSLRGLYIATCLCVDGGGNVFFRGKDGIYVSPGGSGSRSITDDDLYPIFPHEGVVPQPVTIGNSGRVVYPPDDTQPEAQKLSSANGYLYYDYLDTGSIPRTLTFDIIAGGWVWDVYEVPVTVHALEEGPNINDPLVGCQDGSVRRLSGTGAEAGTVDICLPSNDAGDTRAKKQWGDIYMEVETLP